MRRLAILAAAAAVFGAASAHAGDVPATFPPVSIGLQVGSTFIFGPGNLIGDNSQVSGGITPAGPFVIASGSTPPPGVSFQTTNVTASWEFEVLGPTNASAEILISGLYSASSTGATGAAANVFVGNNLLSGLTDLYAEQCANGSGLCGQHPISILTTVPDNQLQFIEIHADGAVSDPGGSYSVSIDPLITLAPGFADQGFSLFVAPDAQPPAGVPEPAAWALMISGFGLAGTMLRRKRAVVTTA